MSIPRFFPHATSTDQPFGSNMATSAVFTWSSLMTFELARSYFFVGLVLINGRASAV